MTISHRLRTVIEDITPRIPEHNRRELEEIADRVEALDSLDNLYQEVLRDTILLGQSFTLNGKRLDPRDVYKPVDEEDGA